MKIVDILSAYINNLVFIYKPSLSGDLKRKKGQTKYKSPSEGGAARKPLKSASLDSGGKKNKNHNSWNFTIHSECCCTSAHSTSKFDRVKFTDLIFAYIEVHTMLKRPASCSF